MIKYKAEGQKKGARLPRFNRPDLTAKGRHRSAGQRKPPAGYDQAGLEPESLKKFERSILSLRHGLVTGPTGSGRPHLVIPRLRR